MVVEICLSQDSHSVGIYEVEILINKARVCARGQLLICVLLYGLQHARLLCPWGFSRQEYWSGSPCPSPGDLPNPRIEPRSPALQVDSLPAEPQGKRLPASAGEERDASSIP